MHVCVCARACMCVCARTHACVCVRARMHVCVCARACMCVCVHVLFRLKPGSHLFYLCHIATGSAYKMICTRDAMWRNTGIGLFFYSCVAACIYMDFRLQRNTTQSKKMWTRLNSKHVFSVKLYHRALWSYRNCQHCAVSQFPSSWLALSKATNQYVIEYYIHVGILGFIYVTCESEQIVCGTVEGHRGGKVWTICFCL